MCSGETKRVALGFLTFHEAILLYLRDDRPDISYPNYWALLGGKIEAGETPQGALEREVQEEICCPAYEISFVGKLDVVGNPMCEDHIIYLFEGEVRNSVNEMRLTEGQELRYFTMEEFRTLKFPAFLKTFILSNVRACQLFCD